MTLCVAQSQKGTEDISKEGEGHPNPYEIFFM